MRGLLSIVRFASGTLLSKSTILLSARSIPLACLPLPASSITRWGNLGGHKDRKLYSGDGLASTTPWEELLLLSLYQMTQSLPLVGVCGGRAVAKSGIGASEA
jgi:hypothetical protein